MAIAWPQPAEPERQDERLIDSPGGLISGNKARTARARSWTQWAKLTAIMAMHGHKLWMDWWTSGSHL